MGMIFEARRLSATEATAVAADPAAGAAVLERTEDVLDLDKAWHGIHFLLTGSAWETTPGAGEAVLGGVPVGDDRGYGPARLVAADQVRAVAAGLEEFTAETLRARFDPAGLMAEAIYPQVWDDEDFAHYLLPNFLDLQKFYRAAADRDEAVLLLIT
jgi:hypothetical protein